MKKKFIYLILALALSACSTLDESLELGASLGGASGTAAAVAAYSASGRNPSLESVAIGAGLGAAVGLITSYFTYQKVVEDRKTCEANDIEIHFGDLPPSPFIVPRPAIKRGTR